MNNYNLHMRLPKHEAPEKLWTKIESALNNLDNNAKQKNDLNSLHCPNSVWNKLNYQLNALDKTTNNKFITKLPEYKYNSELVFNQKRGAIKRWMYIAASITILLSICTTIILKKLTNKETIHYAIKEVVIENNTTIQVQNTFNAFERLLRDFCAEKPQVCQNQDYQTLTKQLEHIKHEEDKLIDLKKIHSDAAIDKMLLQLQNDKIKVETYLLKLFS